MKAQAKAQLKSLRMSPRKVRLVVDLVRGMNVEAARAELAFNKKAAARPVLKLLESAVANAVHNHHMKTENLMIETAFVDEGKTLRRWMPRAMGRATPLRKRSSHITLVLTGEVDESKKVEVVAEEDKKEDSVVSSQKSVVNNKKSTTNEQQKKLEKKESTSKKKSDKKLKTEEGR